MVKYLKDREDDVKNIVGLNDLRDIAARIESLTPRVVEGQNARGLFQLIVDYVGTKDDSSREEGYCHRVAAILPEINGRRVDAEIASLDFALERLDSFDQLYIAYTEVRQTYRENGIFQAMYNHTLALAQLVFPAQFRVFLEVSDTNLPMTAFVRSRGFQRQGHAGDLVDYACIVPPKPS